MATYTVQLTSEQIVRVQVALDHDLAEMAKNRELATRFEIPTKFWEDQVELLATLVALFSFENKGLKVEL